MILFGSAGSGSGKTYQIVKRARRMAAAGERVIILQPTKELNDKTVEQELLSQSNPPLYAVFHGGTVGEGVSVAHEITEYLKIAPNYGQIVFATQQVLPRIGFFANKSSWNLIVDEELQVLDHASHRLPETHSIITQHLALEPYNAIYSRIVPSDLSAVKRIAKNESRDDIHEKFSALARILTSDCYRSYVNTEQFEKLKQGEASNLDIHSVLQPSLLRGFASVFMAAANFRDTTINQVWPELGVKFEEDEDFTNSLRFREHKNGSLVTICYADETPWSRNRRDKEWPERDGLTSIQLI
jgi:hypothetical protein